MATGQPNSRYALIFISLTKTRIPAISYWPASAQSWSYVLDDKQQLLPAGVAGELCLAGAANRPGYWQRDDLTAERFYLILYHIEARRMT
jgi:non-ribosomal peptide synthetase component F